MTPIQFCTTSSRRYLPYARALGQSIRQSNPQSTLWVLLTDDHQHQVQAENEPFRCVWNEEIGIETEELHRMFLIHAEEFHIAIKPWIMEYVLGETGAPVMFIDSDIQVYGALDDIGALIEEHGIVLTPHVISPYPLDGLMPDDTTILGAGTFNAGMIGVGRRGIGMLQFLESRLNRESYVDVTKMRVGEQRWLDFVPSFFHCHVLRDPGVNVAYWNLHERPVTRVDGVVHAGGAPLRTYHFSGYSFAEPGVLSRHATDRPRIRLEEQPLVAALCDGYRRAVTGAGYAEAQTLHVDFEQLPGGIPIDGLLRAVYKASVLGAEHQGVGYPPDGYDLGQRPLFLKWAELTYKSAGLAVPPWAAAPVAAVAAPERQAPGQQVPEVLELFRQFATATAAALANIEARLLEVEQRVEPSQNTARVPLAS
jgi:hypothetical protein